LHHLILIIQLFKQNYPGGVQPGIADSNLNPPGQIPRSAMAMLKSTVKRGMKQYRGNYVNLIMNRIKHAIRGDHPSLLPSSAEFVATKVTDNREIAKDVFLVSLERHFDFIPGQVVGIHFKPAPDARLYSITSGTNEEVIKILFNIQPGGMITPKLARCNKGDRLFMSTPFGWFTCNNDPAWWIASGTGIAPFASMFYSGAGGNKILVHGGKTGDSFYFQEDFITGMADRYIRCCSGEKINGAYQGRLTQYLEEQDNLSLTQLYYLCGRVEMVVEVREILIRKGIPYQNIHSEIYF
jgi:ferredoxin/flavodoxin---NADP+ reductase